MFCFDFDDKNLTSGIWMQMFFLNKIKFLKRNINKNRPNRIVELQHNKHAPIQLTTTKKTIFENIKKIILPIAIEAYSI